MSVTWATQKKTYSIDKVKRKKTRLTVDSVFVLLGFVDVRCQMSVRFCAVDYEERNMLI